MTSMLTLFDDEINIAHDPVADLNKQIVKVAFTGHRPNSLPSSYGYDLSNATWRRLIEEIKNKLVTLHATTTITGGALGVDQAAFIASKELGLFSELAIPCMNQDKLWSVNAKDFYKRMLTTADKVTYISHQDYTSDCMQKRNQYMIDNCDVLIAIWDGRESGGTANTVRYAKKLAKPVIIISPKL